VNAATDGIVVEVLTGGLVKVQVDEVEIKAHVAEEVKRVSVPVRPGDRVTVKRSPHDPRRGTIIGVGR